MTTTIEIPKVPEPLFVTQGKGFYTAVRFCTDGKERDESQPFLTYYYEEGKSWAAQRSFRSGKSETCWQHAALASLDLFIRERPEQTLFFTALKVLIRQTL